MAEAFRRPLKTCFQQNSWNSTSKAMEDVRLSLQEIPPSPGRPSGWAPIATGPFTGLARIIDHARWALGNMDWRFS